MYSVVISGVHSGPNPSPGVGVARSLRRAFGEQLRLIGLDYSMASTGLYSDVFDEIEVLPGWTDYTPHSYAQLVRDVRARHPGLWISCLDIESRVLRWAVGDDDRSVLVPQTPTFGKIAKPDFVGLGENQIVYLPSSTLAEDSFGFARVLGWNVWVKGTFYEAIHVHTWAELQEAVSTVEATWGRGTAFVQQHINGAECSLAFAAYDSQLVACCWMDKVTVTPEGKTWSGRCGPLPDELQPLLQNLLSATSWTGGCELEFVRETESGRLYLIDWNPRFPAWIHGATLAGNNLPAALVSQALDTLDAHLERLDKDRGISGEFVRVVYEIPVPRAHSLPEPVGRVGGIPEASKHPSGMPTLAQRVLAERPLSQLIERDHIVRQRSATPDVLSPMRRHLAALCVQSLDELDPDEVPFDRCKWVFVPEAARYVTTRIKEAVTQPQNAGLLAVAYSVKTNPYPELLSLLANAGLMAEVIGSAEYGCAVTAGFERAGIVINGSGKTDDLFEAHRDNGGTLIFDSVEEAKRVTQGRFVGRGRYGLRVKAHETSRFGIDLFDVGQIFHLSDVFAARHAFESGITLHAHLPTLSSSIRNWTQAMFSLLDWAQFIEEAYRISVTALDFGGGWDTEDLFAQVLPVVTSISRQAQQRLSRFERVLLELGRAIFQQTMIAITRILEVRDDAIIVGTGITELPTLHQYPHAILCISREHGSAWAGKGRKHLWGRLCMETDILGRDLAFPEWLRRDDLVAFLDVGSYDYSMGRPFGIGGA